MFSFLIMCTTPPTGHCHKYDSVWNQNIGLGPHSLNRRRLYRNPHYKLKTVWRPSQVYNGNPYANKMVSSWWIEDQTRVWGNTPSALEYEERYVARSSVARTLNMQVIRPLSSMRNIKIEFQLFAPFNVGKLFLKKDAFFYVSWKKVYYVKQIKTWYMVHATSEAETRSCNTLCNICKKAITHLTLKIPRRDEK